MDVFANYFGTQKIIIVLLQLSKTQFVVVLVIVLVITAVF